MALIRWLLLLVLPVACTHGETGPGAPVTDRALFYELSGPGGRLYIMGTLHLGVGPEHIPQRVRRKLQASRALILETDGRGLDGDFLRKIRFRPQPETTRQVLGPAAWERLQVPLPDKTAPQLNRMSDLSITLLLIRRAVPPGPGIDHSLLRLARRRGIPVAGLEEARSQWQLLTTVTDPERLRDLILNYDEGRRQLADLIRVWKQGDLPALVEVMQRPALRLVGMEEERLLHGRNRQWIARIPALLQQQGSPLFIAVGAAHLPGKQGLLAGLEKLGFRPDQEAALPEAATLARIRVKVVP